MSGNGYGSGRGMKARLSSKACAWAQWASLRRTILGTRPTSSTVSAASMNGRVCWDKLKLNVVDKVGVPRCALLNAIKDRTGGRESPRNRKRGSARGGDGRTTMRRSKRAKTMAGSNATYWGRVSTSAATELPHNAQVQSEAVVRENERTVNAEKQENSTIDRDSVRRYSSTKRRLKERAKKTPNKKDGSALRDKRQ